MRPRPRAPLALLAAAVPLLATRAARGDDGAGTLADPIELDAFPYAHAGDTTDHASNIDRYACASTTDESGPEVVYHLAVPAAGRLTAWLAGDVPGAVDIDVQILTDPTLTNREGTCVARGNTWAEADVTAGEAWIVVDSYVSSGVPRPGPYQLRVDFSAVDQPRERPVAQGVVWRQTLYASLYGGDQTVNQLEVDLNAPGVALRPAIAAAGCERVSSMGARTGAVAGVNGGFFDPANACAPVSLVRIDDRALGFNRADRPPRSALGLSDLGPVVQRVAGDDPWNAVHQGVGGTPQLVRDGAPMVLWSEESAGQDFATYRHPRTAACIKTDGKLLFVTFDGRSEVGTGVSLFDLADYLVAQGCRDGLNYDGGGSTTFWVASQPAGGVVNYPSDGGMANHQGERSVSNGWFVYAPPVDLPPRFSTHPVLSARDGETYLYDADAVDLELSPVTFSLVNGPAGMTVRAADGHVAWTPSYRDGGAHPVVLRASDGLGSTEQSYEITVTVRDSDGDGLPDGWETEFGTDPARDDDAEDPDGDGADNLAEYRAGTDPHDPHSVPPGVDIDASSDGGVGDAAVASDARSNDTAVDGGGAVAGGGCGCRAGSPDPRSARGWGMLLALAAGAVGGSRRRRRAY